MANVDIQLACAARGIPSRNRIRSWVLAALGKQTEAELTVRIVDMQEGKALNRRWRGRRQATNVLSFPVSGLAEIAPGLLGDIVVCAPVVEKEAVEQHKELGAHWAHMIVHGVLHLRGYDHECRQEAEQMESMERAILKSLGYRDPYNQEST